MSHGCPLDRWTGQDSGTSLVTEGGMSNGCPMDVHWTGGLGTSLVSEGGMSNGYPMDIHWTGGTIPSGQRILMANLDMSGVKTVIFIFVFISVLFKLGFVWTLSTICQATRVRCP